MQGHIRTLIVKNHLDKYTIYRHDLIDINNKICNQLIVFFIFFHILINQLEYIFEFQISKDSP